MGRSAEPTRPTPWVRAEDGLAVLVGLLVVALVLGSAAGSDLLGWAAAVKEWADPAKAVAPAGESNWL